MDPVKVIGIVMVVGGLATVVFSLGFWTGAAWASARILGANLRSFTAAPADPHTVLDDVDPEPPSLPGVLRVIDGGRR